MAIPLFAGRVIAVIWDFDQTLIPGYQQKPLFEHYAVDETAFWREVDALADHYRRQDIDVSPDTIYLNHILTYVRSGRFPGLNNAKLRELGAKLALYPGMPEFVDLSRSVIQDDPVFREHEIKVEHYVVSTGLRQVMRGSAIASHVDGIWGCEFIEEPAGPGFLETVPPPAAQEPSRGVVSQVGYFLDNTTKTRAIWEINKGTNRDPNIGVNDLIAPDYRRVPIPNMIYVADGPSDIPVFSILNTYGGQTLGVHNGTDPHYEEVRRLEKQGRVKHFTQADYRPDQDAYKWIIASLRDIAESIVRARERLRSDEVRKPARHVPT